MTWRAKQGLARFRGVPFRVGAGERQGGREVVLYKVPFSEDAPHTDDLGRSGRPFSVEGYVVGSDYEAQRDALLTALETPGPGDLVHPYFGTRRVAALSFSTREDSSQEGGIARFTIQFHETSGAPAAPVISVDTAGAVASSVAGAKPTILAQFLASYSAGGRYLGSVTGALQAAANSVNQLLDLHSFAEQDLARLKQQVENLQAGALSLVGQPEELAASIGGLVEAVGAGLLAAVSTSARPFVVLLELARTDFGDRPPDSTPARAAERESFDAFTHLVQRYALLEASTALLAESHPSYDDAIAALVSVTAALDEHLETASDDTFVDLNGVRAALVAAVPGADADLPRLGSFTPPAAVPSLVLAHRLYGRLEREADMIARNHVADPCFVPGGKALEVLSD